MSGKMATLSTWACSVAVSPPSGTDAMHHHDSAHVCCASSALQANASERDWVSIYTGQSVCRCKVTEGTLNLHGGEPLRQYSFEHQCSESHGRVRMDVPLSVLAAMSVPLARQRQL